MEHPRLGKLEWKESIGYWAGRVESLSGSFRFQIDAIAEDLDAATDFLERIIFKLNLMKQPVIDKLYKTYLDWEEDETERLTEDQFFSQLTLYCINIDGFDAKDPEYQSATLFYSSRFFSGHSVIVNVFNLNKLKLSVQLFG